MLVRAVPILAEDRSASGSASTPTSTTRSGPRRSPRGQGGGRGGHPGQERVPGQHEPRDPHADERHPRDDRAAPDRPHRPPARVSRPGQVGGRRPLTVINDILDFSKIEAGKLELDPVPFASGTRSPTRSGRWRSGPTTRGWSWPAGSRPDVPDWLVGDPGRLRQVLVNLVGNAIKFTERGEVVVSVEADGRGRPIRRGRHRDRHPGREARGDLRAVRAGRRLDHPEVRRDRPGPGDLSRPVDLMGRIWVEEIPAGEVFRFTAATAARSGPRPVRPARPGRAPGPGRRRQPDQPADPGGDPLAVGMPAPSAVGGPEALAAMAEAVSRRSRSPGPPPDRMMPGIDGLELAGGSAATPASPASRC